MKPLPQALKALRGSRPQWDIAREIGVSRVQYNRWEQGHANIGLENLQKLVALGLDQNYLLGALNVRYPKPHTTAQSGNPKAAA